jgi:hypothetical protein
LLQPGVMIHFHDIFWPFEYAEKDIFHGRSWNEAYLLRAFLANNGKYQVELFGSWLESCHSKAWQSAFPQISSCPASSLWLRKQ